MTAPKTLFQKIWDAHVVDVTHDGLSLIYADRLMLMEMQPQAFEALRLTGRTVRQPDKALGVIRVFPQDFISEFGDLEGHAQKIHVA